MFWGSKSFLYFVTLTSMTALLSCSPKGMPTKLSIQFQEKIQSLDSNPSQIMFLTINVSGPGMDLVSQDWDCDRTDCSEVSLEVRTGSDRLIQLLVVYIDGSTQQNLITYGDVTRELSGGFNRVEIDLDVVGNFSNQGDIVGRYIPTASHPLSGRYLTGEIDVWASVASGKPDMRLESTEIFGGWLKLFVLDTLGFRYTFTGFDQQGIRHEDVPILNDLHGVTGLRLDTPSIQGQTNRLVRYSSSVEIYDDRDEVMRPFPTHILGFLGHNPDNQVICLKDDLVATSSFDGENGFAKWCTNSACSSYLSLNDISPNGLSSGDTCASGTSHLPIDLKRMGRREQMLNVRPPLVGLNGGPAYTLDFSDGSLTWNLAPNIYLPQGLEVFVAADENFNDESVRNSRGDIDCNLFGDAGLTSLGVRTQSQVNFELGNIFTEGPRPLFLCPRRSDGSYYKSVLKAQDPASTNGMNIATKLNLRKPYTIGDNTLELAAGVCHPFLLEALDDSGLPAWFPDDLEVGLTSTDAIGGFYTDSTCDSANIISEPILIKPHRDVLYYKTDSETGTHTLTAGDNGDNLTAGTIDLTSISPMPADSVRLIPEFYRADNLEMANTEQCVPFLLVVRDESGRLTTNSATVQIMPNNGAQAYASEADCKASGTPIPSTDEIIQGPTHRFYLSQPTGTIIENALANCISTSNCEQGSIQVVSPGDLDHLHVRRIDSEILEVNSCLAFRIQGFDNHKPNSYPVPLEGGDVSINAVTGTASFNLYDGPDCQGSDLVTGTPSLSLPEGGSTKKDMSVSPSDPGLLRFDFVLDGQVLKEVDLNIDDT